MNISKNTLSDALSYISANAPKDASLKLSRLRDSIAMHLTSGKCKHSELVARIKSGTKFTVPERTCPLDIKSIDVSLSRLLNDFIDEQKASAAEALIFAHVSESTRELIKETQLKDCDIDDEEFQARFIAAMDDVFHVKNNLENDLDVEIIENIQAYIDDIFYSIENIEYYTYTPHWDELSYCDNLEEADIGKSAEYDYDFVFEYSLHILGGAYGDGASFVTRKQLWSHGVNQTESLIFGNISDDARKLIDEVKSKPDAIDIHDSHTKSLFVSTMEEIDEITEELEGSLFSKYIGEINYYIEQAFWMIDDIDKYRDYNNEP